MFFLVLNCKVFLMKYIRSTILCTVHVCVLDVLIFDFRVLFNFVIRNSISVSKK